ncbi:hypothetical protein K7432_002457 [Basidiobolus ranarum]|uniref:Uncharacterized protein n=1 Tax=Basidiobolus ranarum TaxID=34480 RepID=A0ABR2X1G5_9FUNG
MTRIMPTPSRNYRATTSVGANETPRNSEDSNGSSLLQHPTVFAQIFKFQKWKLPKHSPQSKTRRNHPLHLFYDAEQQLSSSIKLLESVRDVNSARFRRCTDRVHQHQTELLNTIYLVYCEMDSVLKCSRGYRRHLPTEDREELDQGFSETILFAAQALSRGFQIRGIEHCSEELREPAQKLCATFEALRYVFQYRAVKHPYSISLVGLFPVLMDFDQAWVEFERLVCYTYFNINGRRTRLKEKEDRNEWSLWVGLMWSTLGEIIKEDFISGEAVKEYDPTIFFTLPRMSLLNLLKNHINLAEKLKVLSPHGESMKQIFIELTLLSPAELLTLQRWLCGGEVNPATLNIHRIFTKLCAIVDPLQSGPEAKFFLAAMSKVFKRYIKKGLPEEKI